MAEPTIAIATGERIGARASHTGHGLSSNDSNVTLQFAVTSNVRLQSCAKFVTCDILKHNTVGTGMRSNYADPQFLYY